MSEDYSNQTILKTYQSIVHVSGDKKLYDGTGSLVIVSSASVAISASFSEDANYALSAGYALTSPYTSESSSINTKIGNKQDVLVSGTNIKTINGQSVLGSGNITTYVSASGQNVVFGDVLANKLTANEYVTVSSSVLYSSGSTKFGDSPDDNHEFTGSVFVSGSLVVNGNIILPVPSGIISSSNQISYIELNNIPSGIISSSNQISSIPQAETASYLNNSQGFVLSSQTSSIVISSASYSSTSSWANNLVGFNVYSSSISASLNTKIGDSYETVSNNLKDYPKSLTYSGTTLLQVTHSLSDGSYIYKIFTYSGSYITTASLSGNLPIGIKTNKILSYNSSGSVIGINYT